MSDRSSMVPNNVFEFENEEFFEFVKFVSGEKMAILLQFQEITNVQCFLDCDDPFEILSREPPKTSPDIVARNNASSIILTTDNLTYSSNSSTQPSINISSSSAVTLTINDEQKQHIIQLLDEWCEKIKEDSNQQHIKLKEGVDYELIIDYMSNKAQIKCQCGTSTTLGKKIIVIS
ncbi:unnamed protein product [Rotaria magnacalcarata]|uniref:Uncharacterized protein n=1 Tax=Rotaria magnacalcarata TaxID=392030 RepID=A0A816U7D5_9BILA